MTEQSSARAYVDRLASNLGVDPLDDATIETLLELAGVAAHSSERIAAPLTCYLVGRAGVDPAEVLASLPVIREATIADLPMVASLIRDLAEYEHMLDEVEWDEVLLAETLFGPEAVPFTLVADDPDAGVVGIAICYRTYSTFQGRPGIWLEDLFVRPERRGDGHGRALLQELFDRADGGRVEWSVLDWNEPSIRFYDAVGAKPVTGWTRYRWLAED